MKDKTTTLLLAVTVPLIVILSVLAIQLRAGARNCSYLDPLIIDILAFAASLFLIVEGAYRIIKEKDDAWQRHLPRIMRIAFGCSILTIHIIQVLHK